MEGIDPVVIAKIMIGHSCADLETVLNEAGLYAGYQRAEHITMEHVLKACLHTVFDRTSAGDEQDDFCSHLSDPHHIASHFIYHEAGHAVVSEVLCPGSVTLVFAGGLRQEEGGFTSYYRPRHVPPGLEKKPHCKRPGGRGGHGAEIRTPRHRLRQ